MKKIFVCALMVVSLLCLTVPVFALQYQGEWVDFVTYSPDDVVKYVPNGIVYVAIGSGLAVPPPSDPTNWVMLFISGSGAVASEWSDWSEPVLVTSSAPILHDFSDVLVQNTTGFIETEVQMIKTDNVFYGVSLSKLAFKMVGSTVSVASVLNENVGYGQATVQLAVVGNPGTSIKLYSTSGTSFYMKWRYRMNTQPTR